MSAETTSPEVERDLKRKIQASRMVVYTITAVAMAWTIVLLAMGDFPNAAVSGIVFVGYLVSIAMFWVGRDLLARVYWISLASAGIFFGQFVATEGSNVASLFLPMIGLPFLSFSLRKERVFVWAGVLLTGGLWSISTVITLEGIALDPLGIQAKGPEEVLLISNGISFSTTIILIAVFAAFGRQSRVFEEILIDERDKAKASAQAKGEFLANMSHEIRTPMNGVIGMLEVLESQGMNEQQKGTIETIKASAFALLRIIDDILDTSKIEAGKLSLESVSSELRPIVEGVAETVRPTAVHLDVHIRLWIDPKLPEWIHTDPGRLRQVLLNLVSNAVKFSATSLTGREGVVFVKLIQTRGSHLVIEIRDNGLGMSEEVQQRLFQPFSQGESSSTRRVGGTGLGLVISRNLVEMFGGNIRVRSKLGEGSLFSVNIPFRDAKGPSRLPNIGGASLVWVEDDDYSATDDIKMYFERAGCNATFISSPEAIEAMDVNSLSKDTVFLIASQDPDRIAKLRFEISAATGMERIIEVTEDRTRPTGLISNNHFVLQIYPMRFYDLHDAIHSLAVGEWKAPKKIKKKKKKKEEASEVEGWRILVVEDISINQVVIKSQLALLGHEVEVANDGEAGLRLWKKKSYDLVLTDCHMPILDGYEMTSAIRSEEAKSKLPATPIIATTANALAGEAEKCYAAGMDGYLSKPFSLEQLRDAVDDAVDSGEDSDTG